MKVARFEHAGANHYGLLVGDDRIEMLDGTPFEAIRRTGKFLAVDDVTLLCPVEAPRIIGAAYNFKAHTQETGKEQPSLPVLFMKPSTAATGPDSPILYPAGSEIVHYEAELVAVIGRRGRHIEVEKALEHVFGYTCGNDISDRVVQREESRFGCLLAGKGYDTFAPLGPIIATDIDPANLTIALRQNGVQRQYAQTSDLVHSVAQLVSYISRFMTLLPGDVIMTGTPAGVGPIAPGDLLEVEIPGIGILRNPVRADE